MPKGKSKEIVLQVEIAEEPVLSASEANKLRHCEKVLEQFRKDYYAAGEALKTIRDSRLYRTTHGSFELYLQEKWGMSRPWAYELIGVSEVRKNLSAIPDMPMPASMTQTSALAVLKEPADQVAAWRKVVATTPREEITEKRVEAVVKERREKAQAKAEKKAEKAPTKVPRAMTVSKALNHIEAMTDKRVRGMISSTLKPAEIIALSKLNDSVLRETASLVQKGLGYTAAVEEIKGRLQPGDAIRAMHTKAVQGDGWYEGTVGSFYHVCVDEKTKEAMQSKYPGWPFLRKWTKDTGRGPLEVD
jgi:hypothetical protein